MTCRKCRGEFCWICFGDWKSHTACNAFAQKELSDSRAALEKYAFYW